MFELLIIVGAVGWIWLIVYAFREGDIAWAIGSIFFTPLVPIIYGVLNFKYSKLPFLLMISAWVLLFVLAVTGAIQPPSG